MVDADMGCAVPTQAYMSHMNKALIERAADENPWDFQFTRNLASSDSFEDTGPSVVLASPGMLQNGVSRNLFERWCEDPKNCVIIAGYSVEGTLARDILSNPSEITSMEGRKLRLNAAVHNVSFSGTLRLGLTALIVSFMHDQYGATATPARLLTRRCLIATVMCFVYTIAQPTLTPSRRWNSSMC